MSRWKWYILALPLMLVSVRADAHWLIHHKAFNNSADTVTYLELALELHDNFVRSRADFDAANSTQTHAMIEELKGFSARSEIILEDAARRTEASLGAIDVTISSLDLMDNFVQAHKPDLVSGYEDALRKHGSEVSYTDPVTGQVVFKGIQNSEGSIAAYRTMLIGLRKRTEVALAEQRRVIEATKGKTTTFTEGMLSGQFEALSESWENLGASWTATTDALERVSLATIKATRDIFPKGFPELAAR